MKIKLMGILFMFFSFYTQLLASSLVLNPLTADFLLARDEFNLTKKTMSMKKPLECLMIFGTIILM